MPWPASTSISVSSTRRVCVFFTLNRSFYPSTSSTTSARPVPSILEVSTRYPQGIHKVSTRYQQGIHKVSTRYGVTKLRHRDTTLLRSSKQNRRNSMQCHAIILLFLLPSDNVQHDLQHRSLITFLKQENLGNKRKPIAPSLPPFCDNFRLVSLYWVRQARHTHSIKIKRNTIKK